ncbi:MAG: hypothetical protein ACLVH2_00615 [Streptococcus sp.]
MQRETQQIENKKRQSTLVTKQRVLRISLQMLVKRWWLGLKRMQFVDAVLELSGTSCDLTFGAVSAAKLIRQLSEIEADASES